MGCAQVWVTGQLAVPPLVTHCRAKLYPASGPLCICLSSLLNSTSLHLTLFGTTSLSTFILYYHVGKHTMSIIYGEFNVEFNILYYIKFDVKYKFNIPTFL